MGAIEFAGHDDRHSRVSFPVQQSPDVITEFLVAKRIAPLGKVAFGGSARLEQMGVCFTGFPAAFRIQ